MISEMLADFFAKFSIQYDKSSMDGMEQSVEKAKKNLDSLGKVADKVADAFSHLKLIFASVLGVEGIAKTFEVNTELSNTFNQIVNATGSADIASEQMKKIIAFADKSKLSILGLTDSFGPFENQMTVMGISADKSIDIFKKLQTAFAGAHLTNFQAQLSQRDVSEFISGTASLERLKRSELGLHTAIIPSIEKKLGVSDPKKADEIIKRMSGEQRAHLIADVSYQTYSKGQAEYEKGPMAALVNVKNQFTKLAIKIGDSGFMDLAIKSLNVFAGALEKVGKAIDFVSDLVQGIKKAFDEVPEVMWTVVGAIAAVTIALNASKIAMVAEIVVEKMLIAYDAILAVMNGTVAFTEMLVAAPLWLIVLGIGAVIAAVALLVDDLYTYFHGGKSVTGLVVNSLQKAFHTFLVWFDKIGTQFSLWFYGLFVNWVKAIDEFGESLVHKVSAAFTKLKVFLTKIFDDIKSLFFDSILGPMDKLLTQIGHIGDKVLGVFTDKLTDMAPHLNAKLEQMVTPNLMYNPLPTTPLFNTSSVKTSHVQNSFSPSYTINVPERGLNDNDLAFQINSHVENTLNSHYSSAFADVTRRE